ncbi:LacI family DNA-binding transcriptional regulator [Candidatus Enterococcus willemsii]|uniref:LacI family transcriptional regulator n=1 Tax=Candidatus Enterococcus willemsii TaxID=1857215 RepID=A0ABQ6Z0T5_9ENTE|nr:LacI family DNA-binding transcriptional regulator [Enterococcus sp. CU12B]KAF1304621.1 LacI family transcriptional regulator [Enterococcus sp. CU12B]
MATIQEVAKHAGVSVGSVSRYLNGHKLKDANMQKIEAAIAELNYTENYFAKGLKINRTQSIGLLMNNLQSHFSSSLVANVGDELEKRGYSMLLSAFRNNHSQVKEKLDFLLSRKIDGLIIFEAEQEWEEIQALRTLDLPIISINTPIEFPKVDSIMMNNRESTCQMIQKIMAYGHTNIGIIAAQQTDYIAQERLAGVYDAFSMNNCPLNPAHIYYGNYSKDSGYKGMKNLLQNKELTAIFVCNYNMSLGALQYIYEHDLRIGDDLSFASFDYFDMSDIFQPRLSVIHQPVTELGEVVASRIVEKIQNNNQLAGERLLLKNKILWHDSVRRLK